MNFATRRTIRLLAVVFAVEQFRHYVYGKKFTLITDHEPLKHFHTSKKPDLRFNRLKAALIGYSFDVVYRPGNRNVTANALSCNPILRDGEVNPERPRAELYQLADEQEQTTSRISGTPPARIFISRAIKKQGLDRNKKIKREKSDSEGSLETRVRKKKMQR